MRAFKCFELLLTILPLTLSKSLVFFIFSNQSLYDRRAFQNTVSLLRINLSYRKNYLKDQISGIIILIRCKILQLMNSSNECDYSTNFQDICTNKCIKANTSSIKYCQKFDMRKYIFVHI